MPVLVGEFPPVFVRVFAFFLGASVGSFLNVVVYRLPRGLSVVKPRSFCPSCKTPIAAYDNIPIFGWLLLRGRTRCCKTKLSPRYPMVEALVAVLALAIAERFVVSVDPELPLADVGLEAFYLFTIASLLVALAFIDLDTMLLPDELVLPGAAIALVAAGIRDRAPSAIDAALGAGIGFLTIQVLFVWGYEKLSGRRGMGEGDAKLMLLIGAATGWHGAIFALVAGALQGAVVSVALLLSGKNVTPEIPKDVLEHEAKREGLTLEEAQAELAATEPPAAHAGQLKVPFGPFLALGALEFLLFGDFILRTLD